MILLSLWFLRLLHVFSSLASLCFGSCFHYSSWLSFSFTMMGFFSSFHWRLFRRGSDSCYLFSTHCLSLSIAFSSLMLWTSCHYWYHNKTTPIQRNTTFILNSNSNFNQISICCYVAQTWRKQSQKICSVCCCLHWRVTLAPHLNRKNGYNPGGALRPAEVNRNKSQ